MLGRSPPVRFCGECSHSRHSCYLRRLHDLPWQGVSVQLWATVGRFRCRNPACPRKIFCERLPHIARAYARQTERAAEIVRLIGYVAVGRPGQRILERLSMRTSDDTVLRRIQEESVQQDCLPTRNLGVDDWAWRKGQEYGTILVNLDLHRMVDLLPDRAAESFSEWLKQHPEIATISRDRCGLYADGADYGRAAIAADRRSVSSHPEFVGDHGARAGGAQPATCVASDRECGDRFGLALSRRRKRCRSHAVTSDARTIAPSATIGALPASCQHVQLRPVAGSHRPGPGHGKEDDPTLAA